MQQQHYRTTAASSSLPLSGEITGWFGRTRARLFGSRDPVAAQLRDIARQGAFGAAISHFFATLLIVLFSVASLIALGADSLRAVLTSLDRGTLDIPNAVATAVTALLVPAMDVAILRAASKIRLLATRRGTTQEMALHIGVVVSISAIEACTYCYMAAVYEHPAGWEAWSLIAARALAAPLIGVYLAMDRPHPVTSRDILAQVELGAGQGVIRDVSFIANDPDAPLARKMELFGASAVMRENEAARLERLIAVAQAPGARPLPAARVYAASATMPEPSIPEAHHGVVTNNKMMHDWDPSDIPDEVEYDGPDSDPLGYQTGVIEAIDAIDLEDEESQTYDATPAPRGGKSSGAKRANLTASKSVRQANREMRAEGKQARKRQIREAGFALLDERQSAGLKLEDIQPYVFAKDIGQRANLKVYPSPNTAMRLIGPWRASRARRTQLEREPSLSYSQPIPPLEPDELRELTLQEVW